MSLLILLERGGGNTQEGREVGVTLFMYQSIPAAPSSPPPTPGYCGAFAYLVSPGGGTFENFALLRGRAFANPVAIPKLLTCTQFPIRI